MERLVFHIDVNSAFLSWESVKRVSEGGEDLRLIPSAIGGDKEKRHGIILAKSIPAKKFGVTTGEPVGMALRKCPNLVLARPDFQLYRKCSHAFMDICRQYTPVVEKASIDECYLDMSGMEKLYPDPVATAYALKDRIRDELGFTVNVGVAHNKLLAKMASDFEKPDKVHTLFEDEIEEKMWPLPVRELFLVGRSAAEALDKAYIKTIGALAKADLETVQSILGKAHGKQAWRFANGIDESPVASGIDPAKGFSISTTVEEDVTSYEAADKVLLSLTDQLSARMRGEGARAYVISVTVRDREFKTSSHQRRLDVPTDISSEIYRLSRELIRELWNGHKPLRLLGIALTDVVFDDTSQISLFNAENEEREKGRDLDSAMDAIRKKYGHTAITRASIKDN